jgi:hypothetical protein
MAAALVAAQSADEGQRLSNADAQKDLAEYADCVVAKKAYRNKAVAFLHVNPASSAFFAASMKAADMTCLNAAAVRRHAGKLQMKLQPYEFRRALYPALYRREFGAGGVPAISDAAPLDPALSFKGEAPPSEYAASLKFGECVARSAPAGVHALLLARPYSDAETNAVEMVKPALPGCLPANTTVHLSRDELRSDTGEAMYRLATAKSPAEAAN